MRPAEDTDDCTEPASDTSDHSPAPPPSPALPGTGGSAPQHHPAGGASEAPAGGPPPAEATPLLPSGGGRWSGEQRRLLACVCAGSVAAGALLALMIPFFPLEAAARGVSHTTIGAVFSCYALTQLLACPLMGRLVPRVGVARAYSAGLALAAVATVAFGALELLSDTQAFVVGCFGARCLEALAVSLLNTAAFTLVANKFERDTHTAVSLMETAQGAGVSVGPAVGGALYHVGGYGLPFYALAALLLAVAAAAHRHLPPPDEQAHHKAAHWPLLRTFCRSGDAWLCCLILLTVAMVWASIDASIQPYVYPVLGITPLHLGLYFLVATSLFSVCAYLFGRLHDRVWRHHALVALSMGACSVGLLLMPPSPLLPLQPSRWLLGVGLAVKEVGQAGTFVPLFSMMLRAGGGAGGRRGSLAAQAFTSSVFWTVFSVGTVVGPVAGGAIIDRFDFPVMITALAGWTLLVGACSAVQACREHATHENSSDAAPVPGTCQQEPTLSRPGCSDMSDVTN